MPDVGRVLRAINIPGQSVESFLDLEPVLTENVEARHRVQRRRGRSAARVVPLRLGPGPAPAARRRRHLHRSAREDDDRWRRIPRDLARDGRRCAGIALRHDGRTLRLEQRRPRRFRSRRREHRAGSHQCELGSHLVRHRQLAPASESPAGSRFRERRRRHDCRVRRLHDDRREHRHQGLRRRRDGGGSEPHERGLLHLLLPDQRHRRSLLQGPRAAASG